MKLKILRLFTTILLFAFSNNAQSQTANDSSVDIIPNWKKGEIHSVKIKSTTTNIVEGKPKIFLSTFDATFKILEVSDNGYKIEWEYQQSNLATRDLLIENHLISKLLNTKLILNLSNVGVFTGLENVSEVKTVTNKIVDNLISNNINDKEMSIQFQAAKEIIQSKQGLETVLLKQIKFYLFSFGYNYKLNFIQSNDIKYPSPIGGEPFNAKENVQLTKLDRINSVCIIKTEKIVDALAVRSMIFEVAKKVSKEMEEIVHTEFKNNGFEISENTMQQINFSRGILQKASFTRVMKLGFQNRTTLLEIEEVE